MAVINVQYFSRVWDIAAGTGVDDVLADVIAAATKACEQWCRVDSFENSATVDEYHDIRDLTTAVVWARILPLNSVTTLTDDAQADSPDEIVAADYIDDSSSGRVALAGSTGYYTRGRQAVRLQYDGGYTAALMPAGLKLAVATEAGRIWNNRDRAGIVNEQADGVSVTWEPGLICTAAQQQLEPYRRRVVA